MSEDELPEERRTAPAPPRDGHGAHERHDVTDLPAPGDVIDGKYRVEEVLGAGGMGVVVSATHLGLGERVALKFIRAGRGAPEDLVARLRREARLAFRIKSENVARLLDVGTLRSGAPYLVMEHLEGQDLARVLAARGALPIDEAVDLVLQACEAMAHAHGLGIVHRDLKPSNLFVTRGADGKRKLKVLDFGIAKAAEGNPVDADPITSVNAVLGSPLHMSPEQVRGASTVDARSDIWAIGVILHELVTGTTPFALGPASAVCAAIAADPPKRLRDHRPDAPEELERVVLRCLEKDPAERYESIGELASALAPFASPASAAVLERTASLVAFSGRRVDATAPQAGSAPEQPPPAEASVTGGAWNTDTGRKRGRTRAQAGLFTVSLAVVAIAAFVGWRRHPADPAPLAAPPREVPASSMVAAPELVVPGATSGTSAAASTPSTAPLPSASHALPSPTAVATARHVAATASASAAAIPAKAPASATAEPEDLELRATSRRR